MRRDRLLGPFVHVKLKNVRARVMADDIEIVFTANNLCPIDLSY
jgi:hypothetical protein